MSLNFERHQPYEKRQHAGVALAGRLQHFKGRNDVVVLALPRGGVPVAHEVARATLHWMCSSSGSSECPVTASLAMGAIASGGVRVLNEDVVAAYGLPEAAIDAVARDEQAELERRERTCRNGRAAVELRGRIVLLIDDGLATGATMKVHRRPAESSRTWPMRLCARTRLSTSPPSDGGIGTSRRRLIRKYVSSYKITLSS